jgi:GntR family transcriptional regulator
MKLKAPDARLGDRRPLAVQVRDELLSLIATSEIGPGDQLPTESELADHFAVGRTTVREALKLLEQEGFITSRQGVGRFVTQRPHVARPLTVLEGVTDMLVAHGIDVDTEVLAVQHTHVGNVVGERLGVPDTAPVTKIERRRGSADGALLVYSVDYVAAEIGDCREQLSGDGSLYELLRGCGVEIASAICDITATTLPSEVAARLDEDPSAPWLRMDQVHHDLDGTPRLFSSDFHRGAEFSFRLLRTR